MIQPFLQTESKKNKREIYKSEYNEHVKGYGKKELESNAASIKPERKEQWKNKT